MQATILYYIFGIFISENVLLLGCACLNHTRLPRHGCQSSDR
jgi:predicted nucleotidyltransferase component of viral defense system